MAPHHVQRFSVCLMCLQSHHISSAQGCTELHIVTMWLALEAAAPHAGAEVMAWLQRRRPGNRGRGKSAVVLNPGVLQRLQPCTCPHEAANCTLPGALDLVCCIAEKPQAAFPAGIAAPAYCPLWQRAAACMQQLPTTSGEPGQLARPSYSTISATQILQINKVCFACVCSDQTDFIMCRAKKPAAAAAQPASVPSKQPPKAAKRQVRLLTSGAVTKQVMIGCHRDMSESTLPILCWLCLHSSRLDLCGRASIGKD